MTRHRIRPRLLLGPALALAFLGMAATAATPAEAGSGLSEYKVRDLLKPCQEGDNDSRGGAVLELECEQYVTGFTDAYVHTGGDKRDNVCLPELNRPDEVRWAFQRWAHENFDKRDMHAVEGLLATIKGRFKCQ